MIDILKINLDCELICPLCLKSPMVKFEVFNGDIDGLRCLKCHFFLKSKKKYEKILKLLRKHSDNHHNSCGDRGEFEIRPEKNEIEVYFRCETCTSLLNLGWA